MNRHVLALAGIAIFSACSDMDSRRAPEDDALTRPLEVARVDTSHPLAPVEHQATKTAEPVAKPATPKAKRQPRKRLPPATRAKPAAPATEDTNTAQGYAPSPRDSSPRTSADSVSTPKADTAKPDTAAPPTRDTIAARTSDTTSATDSLLARDSSLVPPPSSSSAAVAQTLLLPIGTEIHAALDDSINSRTDTLGRVVTAVVMEPVTGSDGKTLIEAGAPVRFTVSRLRAARSKSSQGRLALQVEGIGVGGELRKVSAQVKPVPHELRGRGVGTSEVAKVGVGAAGGAVLGRVIGGNSKGAVIGGVVGAAGGAVVASQTAARDVVVKAKTPVVFVLTEPLVAQ